MTSRTPIGFDGTPLSSGGSLDINSIRQQLAPSFVDQSGDNSVGTLVMSTGSTVSNIPTPVNPTDAANKSYVDSQVSGTFSQTQGDSRYLQLTGGTETGNIVMSGATVTGLPNPVNNSDAANKVYVDTGVVYEPTIISSQNPYLHLVCDAYGSTNNSIYDLSPNKRVLSFAGPGSLTFNTGSNLLNNHKNIVMNNYSLVFPRTTALYTAFVVMQYNSVDTGNNQFIFGDSNIYDFHDSGSNPGTGPLFYFGYASNNVKTNSYINGSLQADASSTTKPTTWFLYAFTSSVPTSVNSLGQDRIGTRFGNYAFAEVILFSNQLSAVSFQQITDYLLNKYGITWSYYTPAYVIPLVNTVCGTSGGTAKACLTLDGTSLPTANISMNSKRIISLADPVDLQDAATKNYTDTKFNTADSRYWKLDQTNQPSTTVNVNNNRITNLGNPGMLVDATPISYLNTSTGYSFTSVNPVNYPSNVINLSNFTSATVVNNNGSLPFNFTVTIGIPITGAPTLGTLNNFNTIGFVSPSSYLYTTSTSTTFTAGSTFVALVNPQNLSGQQRLITFINNVSFGFNGTNLLFTTINSQDYNQSGITVSNNQWYLVVYRFNANGSVDFAINGNQSYLNVTGPTTTNSATGINLACLNYTAPSTTQAFVGQVAGIWCFNTGLSNSVIDAVAGEVLWAYGLQSLLPTNHTYKNSRPWSRGSALNMSNFRINNVSDPVNTQDAATKNYVDTNTLNQAAGDSRYLQVTGGTMTGAINMNSQRITNLIVGSVTNPNDAASMANINAVVNTICSTAGGTAVPCLRTDGQNNPTASLTMNNNKITNLADATAATDALNMQTGDARYSNKIIKNTATVGSSTGQSLVSSFVISNPIFTPTSTGKVFLTPLGGDFADTFVMSLRAVTFSTGQVTIKTNTFRVDATTLWGQNLKVNILIMLD